LNDADETSRPTEQDAPPSLLPALLQVGALPIRFKAGEAQILLVTSRESKRWVIPKGWPMRGRKNWAAAAQEAKEEAGIVGRASKKPMGSFLYFKRRAAHFDLCRVEVYPLFAEKRLAAYREKGQREARWFTLAQAAEQVEEAGLSALLVDLDIAKLLKATPKPKHKRGGKKT
jgi:8-oxo-dGTP pyrophosphatase MutT (NUDIX family)